MYTIKTMNEFVNESNNKPVYVGAFLDDANRKKLLKEIPAEFSDVSADHVTIQFGKLDDWEKHGYTIGQEINIKVTGVASADGVQAVTVDTKSTNDNPHITISVAPGHKPFESNKLLSNSKTQKVDFKLKARIGYWMQNGKIKYQDI
jgi:hypothetical protein